jgi:hypothetical protein
MTTTPPSVFVLNTLRLQRASIAATFYDVLFMFNNGLKMLWRITL